MEIFPLKFLYPAGKVCEEDHLKIRIVNENSGWESGDGCWGGGGGLRSVLV